MVSSIIRFFYPDIQREEVKKFGFLATAFLFTIGVYWLMRLLKDVVLFKMAFPASFGWDPTAASAAQAFAKQVSPFVVIAAVAIYTRLVDMFEKHKLFYVIISFYTLVYAAIATVLFLQAQYGDVFLGATVLKYTGYINYWATESFGSLVVALFWSFTVSSCTTDQAKRGFPFIIAVAQLGSIGGSALLLINGLSIWPLFVLAIVFMVCIMLSIYSLVSTVPASQLVSDKAEKASKPDFLAGIRLLVTQPYLMGVLVVSTFYEIAGTVVDFQMKTQANLIPGFDFKWFMGIFGVAVNALAFIMALLGTAYVMKRFGLRVCLLIFPVMFGSALIGLYLYYQSGPTPLALLWATFTVMMLVKATSYAVNNPTKEMMYIPTGKDAKFKTKGMIDMFGNRVAKFSGASINGALLVSGSVSATIANLMSYGTLASLILIAIWFFVAIYVGLKNAQLVRDNQIIE